MCNWETVQPCTTWYKYAWQLAPLHCYTLLLSPRFPTTPMLHANWVAVEHSSQKCWSSHHLHLNSDWVYVLQTLLILRASTGRPRHIFQLCKFLLAQNLPSCIFNLLLVPPPIEITKQGKLTVSSVGVCHSWVTNPRKTCRFKSPWTPATVAQLHHMVRAWI